MSTEDHRRGRWPRDFVALGRGCRAADERNTLSITKRQMTESRPAVYRAPSGVWMAIISPNASATASASQPAPIRPARSHCMGGPLSEWRLEIIPAVLMIQLKSTSESIALKTGILQVLQ